MIYSNCRFDYSFSAVVYTLEAFCEQHLASRAASTKLIDKVAHVFVCPSPAILDDTTLLYFQWNFVKSSLRNTCVTANSETICKACISREQFARWLTIIDIYKRANPIPWSFEIRRRSQKKNQKWLAYKCFDSCFANTVQAFNGTNIDFSVNFQSFCVRFIAFRYAVGKIYDGNPIILNSISADLFLNVNFRQIFLSLCHQVRERDGDGLLIDD